MKTKRNLFSVAIILFVFWFSDILSITTIESKVNKDSLVTDKVIQDENHTATINASYDFSFEEASTASTLNRFYLLHEQSDELTVEDAKEEEISGFSANVFNLDDMATTQDEFKITNDTDTLTTNEDVEPEIDVPSTTEDITSDIEDPKESKSLYSNIGISNADSYVNIRAKANTDSEVLGKLYNGASATILDTVDDWYQIESGSVNGFIKKDYLITGLSDEELISNYGILKITVNVDGLNVRKSPDQSSDKLTVVYKNETYPIVELHDEWIKVDITDDNVTGYVKRELTDLNVKFTTAVSKEEEKKLEELKKQEQIEKETSTTYRNEFNYTKAELKLLACLVHAEAGSESYEGKLAVANIVLNRVKSSKYANTIEKVIYQPGQFTVAKSGSLQKQLNNYNNFSSSAQKSSIKAAKAALEGANNIGSRLYFNSYKSAVKKGYNSKKGAVKIDTQLFW